MAPQAPATAMASRATDSQDEPLLQAGVEPSDGYNGRVLVTSSIDFHGLYKVTAIKGVVRGVF